MIGTYRVVMTITGGNTTSQIQVRDGLDPETGSEIWKDVEQAKTDAQQLAEKILGLIKNEQEAIMDLSDDYYVGDKLATLMNDIETLCKETLGEK